MPRIALAVVLVIVVCGVTMFVLFPLRTDKEPNLGEGRSFPILTFSPRIDLPAQENNSDCVVPVRFSNSGRMPLTIEDFQYSCACSGLERVTDGKRIQVERLVLAPGASEELILRISIRTLAGSAGLNYSVSFRSNDPLKPASTIAIRVPRILSGFRAAPNALHLGQVALGDKVVREISLFDWADTSRKIDKVTTTIPNLLTTEIIPDSTLIPGHSDKEVRRGTLRVRLEAKTKGYFSGTILIHPSDRLDRPDEIPFSVEIVSPIQIRPEAIHWQLRSGVPAQSLLQITGIGNAVKRVISIQPPSWISVQADPALSSGNIFVYRLQQTGLAAFDVHPRQSYRISVVVEDALGSVHKHYLPLTLEPGQD